MLIRKCLFVIGSVMYAIICLFPLPREIAKRYLSGVYICRDITTKVMSTLQISSFLTNKANFPDALMNVNKVLTKDYENNSNCKLCENKPNSKPNKANLINAQMNVNKVLTKDCENIANCSLAENKPNTKPIQTQTNPISKAKNASAYDTGDYHRKIFKKIVNGIDRYLVSLYTKHYGKSIFRQLVNTASQGNA